MALIVFDWLYRSRTWCRFWGKFHSVLACMWQTAGLPVNKIWNSNFLLKNTCNICTKIHVNWYKTVSIRCILLNTVNFLIICLCNTCWFLEGKCCDEKNVKVIVEICSEKLVWRHIYEWHTVKTYFSVPEFCECR